MTAERSGSLGSALGPGLILIGAGGLAREAVEATRTPVGAGGFRAVGLGAAGADQRVIGYLDDDEGKRGTLIGGLPVLGPTTAIAELNQFDPTDSTDQSDQPHQSGYRLRFVAAVASSADPDRRSRLVRRLALPDERYGAVIHPAAALAPSTRIGVGVIILAGVVATCDVTIGRHVALMPGCILTHDVVLGDGCTLASGVQLAGGVVVEPDAYLGTGVTVREGVRIGAGAVIGMGAVVLNDVPPGQVWAGVPARKLR